jgi:hypothetical protein
MFIFKIILIYYFKIFKLFIIYNNFQYIFNNIIYVIFLNLIKNN